jgi:hypothetical protein
MNEPLIMLRESEDGHSVRRFVDGEAPDGGGAARQEARRIGFLAQGLAQRARFRAAQLGHAAAALTKAGLSLARKR